MLRLFPIILFVFTAFGFLFPIDVGAVPIRLRAVPIANFDTRLINSVGTIVGFNDDGDLIAYQVKNSARTTLLKEVRGDITLLALSDNGLVLYEKIEGDYQNIYSLNTTGSRPSKLLYSRLYDYSYATIVGNHKGELVFVEKIGESQYLNRLTSKAAKRTQLLPENFEGLFLADDSNFFASTWEYNDATNQYDFRLWTLDFNAKRLNPTISSVLPRRVRSIGIGSNRKQVFAEVEALDSDSLDYNFLAISSRPFKSLALVAQLGENESLQSYWHDTFTIFSGEYPDQSSRQLTKKNVTKQIRCTNFQNVGFRLIEQASNNFVLAQMQATDSQQRFRSEYMLLVPIQSSLGRKDTSSWSCRLG